MPQRLVVGLGNPGRQYAKTRHNMGFEVLDFWAGEEGLRWDPCRYANALMARLSNGELLCKPQDYMNVSGEVVRDVLNWLKDVDLLVVVDDVALPIGRIRLRGEGASGGHNGLRSIEACIGTRKYARLRIGVGSPDKEQRIGLSDYVLGRFSSEERKILEQIKEKSVRVIKEYWAHGLQSAMTLGNASL